MAQQLQTFLGDTDYLDPFQSGFKPGFNTGLTAALTDHLLQAKDRGNVALLVFLDLSVAFDTIYYGILLNKFHAPRVGGTEL